MTRAVRIASRRVPGAVRYYAIEIPADIDAESPRSIAALEVRIDDGAPSWLDDGGSPRGRDAIRAYFRSTGRPVSV